MSLRIISGERRGAHLATPEGMETRPLRDRIRQALFNMLRPTIRGRCVLDSFAGSGAVGLEALSNGAIHATFVEPSAPATKCIRQNIAKLRYEEKTLVLEGNAPAILAKPRRDAIPFDLLFLMPPYHSALGQMVMADPAVIAQCAPKCTAILEIHAEEPFEVPTGWRVDDDRLYGITRLLFLERKDS